MLTRALAKEPGRRYRSAGELARGDALCAPARRCRADSEDDLAPPAARRCRGCRGAPRARRRSRLRAARRLRRPLLGLAQLGRRDRSELERSSSPRCPSASSRKQSPRGSAASGWPTSTTRRCPESIPPTSRPRPRTISVAGVPERRHDRRRTRLVALGALAEIVRINTEQNEAASPIAALGDSGTPCGAPQASIAFGDGVRLVRLRGRRDRARRRSDRGVAGHRPRVRLAHCRRLGAPGVLRRRIRPRLALDREPDREPVVEFDPRRRTRGNSKITVGQEPEAIAVGTDSLWVANFEDDDGHADRVPGGRADTVDRLRSPSVTAPSTSRSARAPCGSSTGSTGRVTRIDPESGDVVATIEIGNEPQRVAAGEGFGLGDSPRSGRRVA